MQHNPSKNNGGINSRSYDFDSCRQVGDPQADRLVKHLMTTGKASELYQIVNAKTWKEIHDSSINDQMLKEFLHKDNTLPEWADSDKMKQAAALFRSNGNEFLFMLGIVSLPYCYAAARGAKALYHTEKIRKNTEKRLLDTTAFIIEIMREDAFDADGEGFLAAKLVRLRHAIARFYLLQVPEIQQLREQPVNQEDMAGTNLAFSYIALRAMPLIGVRIPLDMQNSYLHFWSVIGHLMGIEYELLAHDLKSAFWLEKKIAIRQFRPSAEGKQLNQQLVAHYKDQIPNKMTVLLIEPLMRHLLGEEVSQLIGLNRSTFQYPLDKLMLLLPLFKKYIFPPVQSFDMIMQQISLRQQQMAG